MYPFLFINQRSMGNILIFIFFSIIVSSYGYDPLDPFGNITVTWDFLSDNGETVDVRVSIYNFQLFRHVEEPGWKLSWDWRGNEVIWAMLGAEAIEQGNCTRFRGQQKPHCCKKHPVIIDLMPGTPYNMQSANCCKGGVLTSLTQNQAKHGASFQMNYMKSSFSVSGSSSNFSMPENFTLGIPGYSCGTPFEVPPTKFTKDGYRWQQVLETWNVTCIYSQFLASPSPKCCVSLSAFYNSTIVPCPVCSCNCQGLPGAHCVNSDKTSVLQMPQANEPPKPVIRCSHHMCPIRVHWHVKQSYKEYWRVKITITNLNFVKNYSQWNLVVLHPNLRSLTQVFSFNYQALPIYGNLNDTGMFWGLPYYNDLLLTHGENGNVQTEILLHKDQGEFTFKEGWTFPRKISFNGDECVMPSPDDYPRLPNTAHIATKSSLILLYSMLLFAMLF
ncbi:COBRA-like protein 6 [Cicer arietinum]|uniref:COBRA-like protein n=1 Tax=Cicer arietinum TaxID=3827 RepID=A0A1S3DYB1_CICAR|nr:COBRA-like protein 6 [Cicer arietinum]